ncbi:hypothetical protein TIFTF001_027527 [Ficus carica]|uniref:Uncharacterized protein n=1 Tax=Ficus carica TaxID=3494 RepID=A0AA88DNC3_FICCA|nr:hypothetical protein TIFTF001_027527 [Ficus carica]
MATTTWKMREKTGSARSRVRKVGGTGTRAETYSDDEGAIKLLVLAHVTLRSSNRCGTLRFSEEAANLVEIGREEKRRSTLKREISTVPALPLGHCLRLHSKLRPPIN